ncbi:TetR family transcriptional regulator [Amycolatopsis endophytica]|uniref:AcrR family transcriptional regulator n=1 Tax=Amycolatopsis endophytica TaxID=860233 RepID=A0A853B972_9PSEU|nr:TetR/AcrR family transcriptional regulator [Amycolatopsis endophytica]NYI91322.1 AcrR family transcriptional regulator [Amycolatopsis endophytica]
MSRPASRTLAAAWHERLDGGLRKQPVQERSRTMIEHVLTTAAELVENLGYEAVVGSPTLLLEKSGVSRGSFYAFFETPESVLDELCYRQMRDATGSFQQALDDRPGKRWAEIVDVVIDYYTQEHRIPLIRELWVRQNLTDRVRTLDELCIEDWAGRVLHQFQRHAPRFGELTQLHCSVALHALERLVQFAFADDGDGDATVLAQAHFMLTRFFAGHSGE